jgi:aspartate aminotransferase
MSTSTLARSIRESPTLKLNATAARLREAGEPVIHLGGGEPCSKAPADALDLCIERLRTGEVRYSPADGLPALKQAIVGATGEQYGKAVSPENVVVAAGAKQAIQSVFQSVLEPGDEVVYPVPYWVSYPEMVKLAGGVPVAAAAADGSCRPAVRDIEAKLGPRTKAIVLNSPNNPSGVLYDRDFVDAIVSLCEDRRIYLLMDDVYNRLVFDGKRVPNPYDRALPDVDRSHLVIIQAVSKTYAMTGFRIGWAVAPREVARAMATIQSHTTSGPATPSQWAALGAFTGEQVGVERLRAALESNRTLALERLAAIPGVRVTPPDGTFYCFPDCRAHDGDSVRLAAFLLEKVRVVTVPGSEFGMEGYLRVSFCGESRHIAAGLDRIRWALDPSAPEELVVGNRRFVRDWS